MLRDARELEAGHLLNATCASSAPAPPGSRSRARSRAAGTGCCVLESGGLEFEEPVQNLYQGANVGLPYFDLDVCRLRFFGGSTNHWAGRCRPLDPLDFEARPWLPHSGWPFTSAEPRPLLPRARRRSASSAPYDYSPGPWLDPGEGALPFDPAKVLTRVWQFSPPTRFGEVYRPRLDPAANSTSCSTPTLVDIETNGAGAEVPAARGRDPEGAAAVRARAYVLACGGLENARLLLAANRQVKVGLGNQRDLVGRYFMEHPHLPRGARAGGRAGRADFYSFEPGPRSRRHRRSWPWLIGARQRQRAQAAF